jgi:hypothetical protein
MSGLLQAKGWPVDALLAVTGVMAVAAVDRLGNEDPLLNF